MKPVKTVSFAELQSMETSNSKRPGPIVTPDFGNSQERVMTPNEEREMLKANRPLDFDLLSQDQPAKSNERAKSKMNTSLESSWFKRRAKRSSRDPSYHNSINSGSVLSRRRSAEKKSKSVVCTNHSKRLNLRAKPSGASERESRRQRQIPNSNAAIVQNLRRRRERQSVIQNRSTSKKKRNTGIFEFPRKYRTIKPVKEAEDSPSHKTSQFYQSQQHNQVGAPENRFQSNPRAPKSTFSKKNSITNNEFSRKPRRAKQQHKQFESKRYVEFEQSKQDIFDSHVLSNGHQSASQSIPKLMINGNNFPKAGASELNKLDTQNSYGKVTSPGGKA